MPTEVDLAYLAGIVDGEGCVRIRKHPSCISYIPELDIANTDSRLIDWLQNNFGGSVATIRKDSESKPCMKWAVSGKGAVDILLSIAPYLKLKTEQVGVVLALQEAKEGFRINTGSKSSDLFIQVADTFRDSIRKLNARGSKKEACSAVSS